MKQYCRYCANCVYGDCVWCDELNKVISESTAKSVNHCKSFIFNPIDAFNPFNALDETKRYKPREKQVISKDIQPTLFNF